MKKIFLALLLVSGFVQAEEKIYPEQDGPVEKGRFVQQDVSGYPKAIITDLKSGCQFMVFTGGSFSATPIGCFPEFIDPKFKK